MTKEDNFLYESMLEIVDMYENLIFLVGEEEFNQEISKIESRLNLLEEYLLENENNIKYFFKYCAFIGKEKIHIFRDVSNKLKKRDE